MNIIQYLQFIENLRALTYISDITISKSGISKNKDGILKPFSQQKHVSQSSVSFILRKYSERDLSYLKHLAKTSKTDKH